MASITQFLQDVVEEELGHPSVIRGGEGGMQSAKVNAWQDLTTWVAADETLRAIGFNPEAENPWEQIGIHVDTTAPTSDFIEQRRTVMQTVLSAKIAHGWGLQCQQKAELFEKRMSEALAECHRKLPEVEKKLKKKKVSKTGPVGWLEPSPLIMEYALSLHGSLSIALHLSDVQRMGLVELGQVPAQVTGQPRVLGVSSSRELYSRLGQAQTKAEEALAIFQGGGVVLWAPENNDQLPRIIAAVQRLYTEKGVAVQLNMLVPYNPLPGCSTADLILDLWGHPLLHPKYKGMVKEVTFIREASKCVFTRRSSPMYVAKNIAVFSVRADLGDRKDCTLSLRSLLIDEVRAGSEILVDVPASFANDVLQRLNAICGPSCQHALEWKLQQRSRGNTEGVERNLLIGYTQSSALAEVRALVKFVKATVNNDSILVGHGGMFGDSTNIVAEGNIKQILALKPLMEACVLISPGKAVFLPGAPAVDFVKLLSTSEDLTTMSLKYRKSGALKGQPFAKPALLQEHVRAERLKKYTSRLPATEAIRLNSQVHIEVLGIEGCNHPGLASKIISKLINETGTHLQEAQDPVSDLGVGEWREEVRDGGWSGKVLIQCGNIEDVGILYTVSNGRGVCIDGIVRTLHTTSPTNPHLGTRISSPSS